MATPIPWNSNKELLCGANDPFGRPDTANRAARSVWQNLCAQHNPDGTHQPDAVILETGSYQSQAGPNTITLQHPDALITFLQITARGPYYPVVAIATMPAGTSKVFNLPTLQTDGITDIATPGEFSIGTNAAVNLQTDILTYDYCLYASLAATTL